MQTIGNPVKLRNSCVALERPPLLGENTDALLRDLCQVEPEELQRLRREGVT
jgi:crotonobetainyl-CoA:carnitine CoA-transferase CaiB-like acyl-CoA transferase